MSLIYTDDVGVQITVDLKNTTIPATTVLTLNVRKPDGSIVVWTPTVNYGTGILTYITVAGDLSLAGDYVVQVHAVFLSGSILGSNTDSFKVYPKVG